jgi:hypothetical protein
LINDADRINLALTYPGNELGIRHLVSPGRCIGSYQKKYKKEHCDKEEE